MFKSSIGIDLGGTKMLVAGEIDGKVIYKKYPTGINIKTIEIVDNYHSFLKDMKISPLSLTVAIPGLVNGDSVMDCDVLPCLKGVSVEDFSKEYSVSFINDVEGAVIEEKKNYKDVKNLVVVMIGTGIGMSMIIDGNECQGASGFTGELGYTTVITESGPTFLDNVSAGAGILNQFGGSAEEFIAALKKSDSKAVNTINRGAKFMGYALSSVIALINPEYIIVGGGTSTYKNYFEIMTKTVDEVSLPILKEATTIKSTTNPGYTVVNGALTRAKQLLNSI